MNGVGIFKVQKAEAGQAVTELLCDVQIVMKHLKFAVFFNTPDLKLMLLRDLGSNPRTSGVLKGIIAMLKTLKTDIVAEGVETEEQVKFLTDLKCDLAQGFLYYKPLKAEDFQTLLPKEKKEK